MVTDNGAPALSATSTFHVTVNEVNSAPVLAAIASQSVNELSTLTLAASASDADLPAQLLAFSLAAGAPGGAAIDPVSGLFTWTPTLGQGGTNYDLTVIVSDNGLPNLSDHRTFNVAVTSLNAAPVLAAIASQTVNEGTTLAIRANASDANAPGQTLTFSLAAGTPAGVAIDPASGLFTWTPTTAQGPGIYSVSIIVRDNGLPPLSATNSFTISVREINTPPIIAPIPDREVNVGDFVSFGIQASDADIPTQSLSFTMSGAPASANILASCPPPRTPTRVTAGGDRERRAPRRFWRAATLRAGPVRRAGSHQGSPRRGPRH